MLLEGLFLPLLTPFYPDGRVYLRKLEHNVERYSRTPAAGLALLTPSGEPDLLSDEERRDILASAIAAAAETKVLLADCSRPGVRESVRLLETAASLGYDAAILRPPSGSPETARTFVRVLSDATPLPLIVASGDTDLLTDIASSPTVLGAVVPHLLPEQMERLLTQTRHVGREVTVTTVFTAVTGRMLRAQSTSGAATFVATEALSSGAAVAVAPPTPALRTRTRKVGFQLLAGSTPHGLDQLRAGARAWLPPFAAAAPQATYEVFAAWKDDDQPLADEKLRRVTAAAGRVEADLGIAGLKAASDLTGYFGGRPRLPDLPLLSEQRQEVEQAMRSIRH